MKWWKFVILLCNQYSDFPIVLASDSSQALQLGQDSFSLYEPRSQRCQMCLRSDSLHKVMDRLANPGQIIASFLTGLINFRDHSSFVRVIELQSKPTPFLNELSGVRRLVIVEAGSKRVEGIISLSDIFKFLLGQSKALTIRKIQRSLCKRDAQRKDCTLSSAQLLVMGKDFDFFIWLGLASHFHRLAFEGFQGGVVKKRATVKKKK